MYFWVAALPKSDTARTAWVQMATQTLSGVFDLRRHYLLMLLCRLLAPVSTIRPRIYWPVTYDRWYSVRQIGLESELSSLYSIIEEFCLVKWYLLPDGTESISRWYMNFTTAGG